MPKDVILDWDAVQSILSLYHLSPLEDFGEIKVHHWGRSYWVRAAGRKFVLRMAHRRRFSDMVFEKNLMAHLLEMGLPVPTIVENVASGTFTPWEHRERYISLFEAPPGRPLGLFEIGADHLHEVGAFLGRMHASTHGFVGHRDSDQTLTQLDRILCQLEGGLQHGGLDAAHQDAVMELRGELSYQTRREPRGPGGICHGGLTRGAVSFRRGEVSGVLGFEHACVGRISWDLAFAISAWCWQPTTNVKTGPAGQLNEVFAKSLLTGYRSVCADVPLDELVDDLRLAALGMALVRLDEFEFKRHAHYEDYRHFTTRLQGFRNLEADAIAA